MIVLGAVPKHWDNFAAVVLATTDPADLMIQGILPLIQNEWHCRHPETAAQATATQEQPWQQVHGRGRRCGRAHGRGRGHGGRPYSRPPTTDAPKTASPVPTDKAKWQGQMDGQSHGPNWERNCAC